jgi:hypothetical protein
LPTTDGGVLRTIEDARHYMLGLPEQRAIANAWQYAAKLILNRAAATEVTRQLSLALFLNAASRNPPAANPSAAIGEDRRDSDAVIFRGKVIAHDPDPRIRNEIKRHAESGWPD